jgi:two-component system sensor histidine kinase/response regulator
LFTALAGAQNTDSLENVMRSGNEKDRAVAAYQLGLYYRYTDADKAIRFLETASQNTADADVQAKATFQMGEVYYRTGNFPASKEKYQLSLQQYNVLGNRKSAAESEQALGAVYLIQGNLAMAAEKYLSALRYYETTQERAPMVAIYNSLGTLYAKQNNFTLSIEYTQKAIQIYEQSSNRMQALVGYENIGNAYMKTENYAKAAEYFNKALKAYTELKNNAGVSLSYFHLGMAYEKSGNSEVASSHYTKALALSEKLNLTPLIVSCCNAMGQLELNNGNLKEAGLYFERGSKLAEKSGMKLELEEAYSGLEEVYKLSRATDKARTFGNLSRELKDSLYNDRALKQLSDLQLRYEAEKKQREIELLYKEQQISESELLRIKQLNTLFMYAGLAIAFVLIILIYFFLQNKRYAANLHKQQRELIEQKDELNRLNEVKDRFFSIISHDLRNNLTTMKLYFDLISHPNYTPKNQRDMTVQIAGSVQNTIDLLENLLVWASSQIKGTPMHVQELDVYKMTQENLQLLAGNAAHKQIELCNTVPLDLIAFGDKDMINLVIRNLLSNAIKFTGTGGLITVTGKSDGTNVLLRVTDNGVGISKEHVERLFDQHIHPTTKGTANEKGTGLGLMLCKDFVQRNGGRIDVESEKGKGTTFTITLPATHA